jgi:hypothetical protein
MDFWADALADKSIVPIKIIRGVLTFIMYKYLYPQNKQRTNWFCLLETEIYARGICKKIDTRGHCPH